MVDFMCTMQQKKALQSGQCFFENMCILKFSDACFYDRLGVNILNLVFR